MHDLSWPPGPAGHVDVVVVGAGGAGMMAALAAARAGCRVLLIEKASRPGGTTALAVGSMMAAGTRQQQAMGVADSAAMHDEDLAGVSKGFAISDNPELRRLMTSHAAEALETLRGLGVVFADPLPQPPHRQPRLHQVIPGSASYVHHLERACIAAGVTIWTNASAQRLQLTDGRVSGLDVKTGDTMRAVHVARAVILASGDIAGCADLLRRHVGPGLEGVEVLNPACSGDGQAMGEAIGARIVSRHDHDAGVLAQMRFIRPKQAHWVQRLPPWRPVALLVRTALRSPLMVSVLRPWVLKFLTTALGVDRGLFVEGALLVNRQGDRFADELAGTIFQDVGQQSRPDSGDPVQTRSPSLLLSRQPDGVGYIVFDERIARQFSRWPHFVSTAPGVAYAYVDDYRRARPDIFHRAATSAALASRLGMDPRRLDAAIVSSRTDRGDKALGAGPYYALGPIKSWLLVTPVGLAVDARLRVLSETGRVIAGLYAAGGAGQGGLANTGHGHGLGWAFTSGMMAGRHAAQDPS